LKIPSAQREHFLGLLGRDEETFTAALDALPESPVLRAFSSGDETAGTLILPDEEGLDLHVRAEQILGRSDYSYDEYAEALVAAERELEAEREAA
jgi:hypothetical protein